ncbi:MAG: hypothetical protein IJW51_04500 [Clostridia bacterium]|nr:hypothetical protein [Clostridia bacterium]
MKKRSTKLYNVFFPVWLLFAHPALIAAALPINFGIDLAVVFLALKHLHATERTPLLKTKVWRTWLFGFAADLVGAVLLFFLSVILGDLVPGTYDLFGHALYLNPFASPLALLIMLAVIALVGWLIYLFNRKFVYRDTALTDKEQKRVCLALAIATAPYLFLLPTAWFII